MPVTGVNKLIVLAAFCYIYIVITIERNFKMFAELSLEQGSCYELFVGMRRGELATD